MDQTIPLTATPNKVSQIPAFEEVKTICSKKIQILINIVKDYHLTLDWFLSDAITC
jgi:hypothetical protein